MKVAKLIIKSVQLQCPYCNALITGGPDVKMPATIFDSAAPKWDRSKPLLCQQCHEAIRLPANPFK